MKNSTGCKKCNRILWVTDVDRRGYCVDCRPKYVRREEKEADEEKEDRITRDAP